MDKARLTAIGQASAVLILMAFGSILMKIVLYDVKPLTFAWLTVGVGMIVMTVYTFLIRKEKIPGGLSRQVWFYIIMIGICNFAISKVSRPFAMERLPVTTVTYIGNFIGFVTMGMSIFILKETPTLFQILGAGIAITGLRIFYLEAPSANEMVGILFILAGIIAVAYTNNIARKLGIITQNKLSNNIVSTLAILIGGSLTVLSGIILDWPPKISGWNNWGIIIYTGVFSISIGLTVWNHILRTLRSYEASILGASTVIYTTLLAVLILGERPAINQVAGIALMLTGLVLVQVRRGRVSDILRRFKQPEPSVQALGDEDAGVDK